jgi:ABC-type transporter Mla subunit MlaD
VAGGASSSSGAGTYRIELQNAFGLVTGADFKVAGVPAGTIEAISLDQKSLNAVVTVQVTQDGFGQFHTDATCESRPESLIGEYFIDCDPELGAAAASRSDDLQAALARADPALTETDQLLDLLANDSTTIETLTHNADTLITALANNTPTVERFIDDANRTAGVTATQQANLRLTLARLPGVLEQLRPTMAQLGTTVTTNEPVLRNLHGAAGQVDRLLVDLPGFSRSPSVRIAGRPVPPVLLEAGSQPAGRQRARSVGPERRGARSGRRAPR